MYVSVSQRAAPSHLLKGQFCQKILLRAQFAENQKVKLQSLPDHAYLTIHLTQDSRGCFKTPPVIIKELMHNGVI